MKPTPRTLFNIDCNVWMYKYRTQSYFYRAPGTPLTAADIQRYVDVLADAGIDALLVNSFCGLAYYPSKTVPTILDGYRRGDRSFFYGTLLGWDMTPAQIEAWLDASTFLLDGYLDLVEAGVDWLAETAAACRRRGVSPWASIRMNDMHGAGKYIEGSYMNSALFKDPAMRLRGTTHNPTAPPENDWQGFNFAQPAVREYTLNAIRDAVEHYDYEGLELDWFRAPYCCEPEADQETIDAITAWHGEIRALTQRQAAKRGTPFPVGIKYLGTLDQLRTIGLDLRAMARDGLLDFVTPTNYWQTSWDIPCDALASELGPEVAVYGAIELAPNFLHGWIPGQTQGNNHLGSELAVDYRLTPACPPLMRGNAAAKLVLGAHGIEAYNFPPADQPSHWPWEDEPCRAEYPELRGIADLDGLRGQPKQYTFSSQTGYYTHVLYESVSPFPCVLGPGERRAGRLPLCAEPADAGLELIVQVVVDKRDESRPSWPADLPPLGVYFNGGWPNFSAEPDECLLFPVSTMTHHTPAHQALNFRFPLAKICEGWNEIVVMHGGPAPFGESRAADQEIRVVSVEVGVRPCCD